MNKVLGSLFEVGGMKLIFGLVLFILSMIMFVITSKYSKFGKGTFATSNDIDQILKRVSMTGVEFFEYILTLFNIENVKIKIKKKQKKGASVLLNRVYLSRIFNENLNSYSFNSSLHELKHIQDRRLSVIKLVFGLLLMLTMFLLMLNFKYFNYYLSQPVLSMFGVLFLSGITITEIISERRAIKFVPENTKKVLEALSFDLESINKIQSFMGYKAQNTLIWYPCASIQNFLLISIYFVILF